MLYGHLTKKENDWYVKTDNKEIPISPNHKLWLLIHAYELLKVCYELETPDSEIAILKACFPDTHEYTQD